jgi:hypothetical protein
MKLLIPVIILLICAFLSSAASSLQDSNISIVNYGYSVCLSANLTKTACLPNETLTLDGTRDTIIYFTPQIVESPTLWDKADNYALQPVLQFITGNMVIMLCVLLILIYTFRKWIK